MSYVKKIIIGILLLGIATVGALAGLYMMPCRGDGEPTIETVEIPEHATGAEIGELLHEKGLVLSPTLFRLALRMTDTMDKLQHGHYQIPSNVSLKELIHILQDGKLKGIRVTIPEGFTIKEIAQAVEQAGIGSKEVFLEGATHYVPYMYMYGPKPVTYRVEGFLFPSTYEFPLDAKEQDVLEIMAKEMNERLTPGMREEIQAQGMTIFEFITLASLVEKEAKYDEDRPIIAAVFKRRLQEGMPLQSCASIQYILGYPKPLLSIEDTQIEDPYNTYLHAGLPPGPIANPGMKSMEAVLYAPPTEYVFFVADKHGHHHFTKTYEEHLKVVEKVYAE